MQLTSSTDIIKADNREKTENKKKTYNREKISLNDNSSLADDCVISVEEKLKRLCYSIFIVFSYINEEDITLMNLKSSCLISTSPSNESEIAFTIILNSCFPICLYYSLPRASLMKETIQFLPFFTSSTRPSTSS